MWDLSRSFHAGRLLAGKYLGSFRKTIFQCLPYLGEEKPRLQWFLILFLQYCNNGIHLKLMQQASFIRVTLVLGDYTFIID